MDGRANTEDLRLHDLIELLEDCRQFYLSAMPGLNDDVRRMHEKKTHCYATMLAEIRQWQARNDNIVGETTSVATPSAFPTGPSGSGTPETYATDDFAALLERVNRIHHNSYLFTQGPLVGRASARRADACVCVDPVPGAKHGELQLGRLHG